MQKTTEDEENIFLSGLPPEFQEWRRERSFLSGSTRNLNNGKRCSYGSKKKKVKAWIPNKRFWEWREKEVVTPECFYQGSTVFKKHGCLAKFQAWQKEKPSEWEG